MSADQRPDGRTGTGTDGQGIPRRVLDAVRTAGPGTGLDDIARRLGLRRDDVDAAIGYWLCRGELSTRRVDCASTGCPQCPLRSTGCAPEAGTGRAFITIVAG